MSKPDHAASAEPAPALTDEQPASSSTPEGMAGSSLTTLVAVPSEVCEVRQACRSVLFNDVSGAGWKLLRLVSRDMRLPPPLRMVQSYTLQLDGNADAMLEHLALSKDSVLARLHVTATDST